MIDWVQFLSQHGIPHKEERHNVYIHCIWCGASDQGFHLGISLRGAGFGCWRNKRHRGRSPVRLVAALLKISEPAANALLGLRRAPLIADNNLKTRFASVFGERKEDVSRLALPKDIKPLHGKVTGRKRIFLEYLAERGYAWSDLDKLCERYELHYAMQGRFAYRIVFPIRDEHGIVTWTGRSISQQVTPRYLTLTTDASRAEADELPAAKAPISNMLFQETRLMQEPARTLIVCEGPFDAMRVDWAHYVSKLDLLATCLFGKTVSAAQLEKLASVADFYDEKLLLLDPDARLANFNMTSRLAHVGLRSIYLPDKYDDPADPALSLRALREFVRGEIR